MIIIGIAMINIDARLITVSPDVRPLPFSYVAHKLKQGVQAFDKPM
jgi:hypothetical protein